MPTTLRERVFSLGEAASGSGSPSGPTDSPLRVALLLDPVTSVLDDPFSLRVRWAAHASRLARELIVRGHAVLGFGAPPGVIPRSSEEDGGEGTGGKLRQFRPDVLLAYDALSTAIVQLVGS